MTKEEDWEVQSRIYSGEVFEGTGGTNFVHRSRVGSMRKNRRLNRVSTLHTVGGKIKQK